ncbi:hypothetical protein OIDMADRAFT_146067 [Oidiodendron maius Zn]|uniref:Uncharacterized protein n=1 Tax=Oidiodendron maius (strain Zn) TaxID=913774 RepID=A0A0C3CNV3_OIDMZ|nr:hypothetical protein OIDMADRAFT_146067 [Oidiodendron maius Zn]
MTPFTFTRNFCLISASLLVIFAKVDALALGPRSTEQTDHILEELQHVLKSSNTSIYDITTPTFRDDWPASAEDLKDRIRRGFTDALILTYYGQAAGQEALHNVFTSPFLAYFPPALAAGVDNVFTNVVGSQMGTGNDKYLSKIFFKYEDTDGLCKLHPDWSAYNKPTGPGSGADSDIVICKRGWDIKDMSVPRRNYIGDEFYGVCGTRTLRKNAPGATKLNDDNYAWLAQVRCATPQAPRFPQVFCRRRFPCLPSPIRSITGRTSVTEAHSLARPRVRNVGQPG